MHSCVVFVSSTIFSLPEGQSILAYALSQNQMHRRLLWQKENGLGEWDAACPAMHGDPSFPAPTLPTLTYSGFPMCLIATFVPVAFTNI